MQNPQDFRSSLSLKAQLINVLHAVDELKDWAWQHGAIDHYSSLTTDYYFGELPKVIIDILLLEDRRFFKHRGVELRAIPRAIKRWLRTGKLGGVSTIEQQLVRTVRNRRERSVSRKVSELALAILINFHRTKSEILLAYANSSYFGPRLYGVDTAAMEVFGCSARQLNKHQSAFLAALLPNPLPKNVKAYLSESGPARDPFRLLQEFNGSNPWWVATMTDRMETLEKARAKCSGFFAPSQILM